MIAYFDLFNISLQMAHANIIDFEWNEGFSGFAMIYIYNYYNLKLLVLLII